MDGGPDRRNNAAFSNSSDVELACVAGRRREAKGSKGAREYRGQRGGKGRDLPSCAFARSFFPLSLPFGRLPRRLA